MPFFRVFGIYLRRLAIFGIRVSGDSGQRKRKPGGFLLVGRYTSSRYFALTYLVPEYALYLAHPPDTDDTRRT